MRLPKKNTFTPLYSELTLSLAAASLAPSDFLAAVRISSHSDAIHAPRFTFSDRLLEAKQECNGGEGSRRDIS